MDIVVSVGTTIAGKFVEPIIRQGDYIWSYKSHVSELKTEATKLKNAIQIVEHQCELARRNAKGVEEEAQNWLAESRAAAQDAATMLAANEKESKSLLLRWIPNPKTRHRMGRKATKTTPGLKELYGRSKSLSVYYEDFNQTVPSSNDYVAFESMTSVLSNIMEALANAETDVVGVYGMGGVGKTTLMKEVRRQALAENLFADVAMATVSQTPDVERIQGEIAEHLNLKFEEDSVGGRANRLRRRLTNEQEKATLIILDDLWNPLDLEMVGIPCDKKLPGAEIKKGTGVKLLLTSRIQNVLSGAMGSRETFPLGVLRSEEAWKLFESIVGDRVNDPQLKGIAYEVVKKCSGLPIPIKAIATTLKDSGPSEWQDALQQLKHSKDAYSNLELSYKFLQSEEAKYLFICALFGYRAIPARDLLRYSYGSGFFEDVSSMGKARDRVNTLLHSLRASSLLVDDNADHVMIHDTVREVAMRIASTDLNAVVMDRGSELKEWPMDKLKKSIAISLPKVKIHELPGDLECPELKIFVLYARSDTPHLPDSFFEGMRELRVLDVSGMKFQSLPSSIGFLKNLTTLCLDYLYGEDISIIKKLKKLQILSLMGSKIARLPPEIGELDELKLLDLSRCSKLMHIEPGMFKKLVCLEELYMESSFTYWETDRATQETNIGLAELNYMPHLSTLDVLIPDAAMLPSELPFAKLDKFRIIIGGATTDWSYKFSESRTLKLKVESRHILLEKWVQATLKRTQDLHLVGLDGRTKRSIHELCLEGFHGLKRLRVQDCPGVEYVVQSARWVPYSAFESLESLCLQNLNSLEKICFGLYVPETFSFSKLKVVKIEKCEQLKNLFDVSLIKGLSHLEEIEVSDCKMLQEIVAGPEDDSDDSKVTTDAVKVELSCSLRRMKLHDLGNITSFYNKLKMASTSVTSVEDHFVFFDGKLVALTSLEELTISELPKLKEIWHTHHPMKLCRLRSLQVVQCRCLLNVINPSPLITFAGLETLTVEKCKSVEEIIDGEGLDFTGGDVEILTGLTSLYLIDLPSLACICKNNLEGRLTVFRNLKKLKVHNCNNLTSLFSVSATEALVHLEELQVVGCEKMDAIVMEKEEERQGKGRAAVLVLPFLKTMILELLPCLTTFACGNYKSVHCPSMTQLKVSECPKMKAFFLTTKDYDEISSPCFFSRDEVLLPSLEVLILFSMGSLTNIWDTRAPRESFCQLRNISVKECDSVTTVFPPMAVEGLQNLQKVFINECLSLTFLFEPTGASNSHKEKAKVVMLSGLTSLSLRRLPELKCVLKNETRRVIGFPSLRTLRVGDGSGLTYLLPGSTARTLSSLDEIDAWSCHSLQQVVLREDGQEDVQVPMLFPLLRSLKLHSHSSLVCFSSGSCLFDFPSLEILHITECRTIKSFILRDQTQSRSTCSLFDDKVEFPLLESMFLHRLDLVQKIWHGELPLHSFARLKSLHVGVCENLLTIFPANTIRRFRNLDEVVMEECGAVGEVFQIEPQDLHEGDGPTTFRLRKLTIRRLKGLKHIWSNDPRGTITFDELQKVSIYNCKSLRTLLRASLTTSIASLEELSVNDCSVEQIIADEAGKYATCHFAFPRLTSLQLDGLQNLRSFCPNSYACEWPSLKILRVDYCDGVRIFSSGLLPRKRADDNNVEHPLFSFEKMMRNLEQLTLVSEDVLMIESGTFHDEIFGKLEILRLACYYGESASFPYSFLLKRFPHLQIKRLVLYRSSFEEIFPDEAGISGEGNLQRALPKLTELELQRLVNLKRLVGETTLVPEILKKIEVLKVSDCKSLRTLFPAATTLFCKLMSLEITYCNGLEYLMTPLAATSLKQLSRVVISECQNIRQVMDTTDDAGHNVCFGQLKHLELDRLPSLTSFSKTNCDLTFPCLEEVVVSNCPEMEIFSDGVPLTPLLKKVRTTGKADTDDGWWNGDLNTTIQHLFNQNRAHQSN